MTKSDHLVNSTLKFFNLLAKFELKKYADLNSVNAEAAKIFF